MPFQSKAQQARMFANKPKMAMKRAKHTPDIKGLPMKKKTKVPLPHKKKNNG